MERAVETQRLGRLLAQAHKSVQSSLDRQLTAIGSSFHTWLVLRQVDRHPGLSQRALAETVGVEGPTLTHHLDRLAAEGLVDRVPHANDRRAWTVQLTAAGRDHLAGTDQVADAHNQALAGALSPGEFEIVASALARLSDRYGTGPGGIAHIAPGSEEPASRDPASHPDIPRRATAPGGR